MFQQHPDGTSLCRDVVQDSGEDERAQGEIRAVVVDILPFISCLQGCEVNVKGSFYVGDAAGRPLGYVG